MCCAAEVHNLSIMPRASLGPHAPLYLTRAASLARSLQACGRKDGRELAAAGVLSEMLHKGVAHKEFAAAA